MLQSYQFMEMKLLKFGYWSQGRETPGWDYASVMNLLQK